MDKRATLNKQATAPNGAVEACHLCGLPRGQGHCRQTEAGHYWCQQAGLVIDPTRLLGQAIDPIKAAVEADPAVRKALAELARLEANADVAVARWESVALEEWRANQRRRQDSQDVVVNGELISIRPQGSSDGELRQLADALTAADETRRAAANKAIKARQELDAARARARRRLAAAAAKTAS